MRKNSVEVSFTFDNQKVYQPLMPSNVMRVGSCCVRRSDEMEKLSRRNFLSTLFTLVLCLLTVHISLTPLHNLPLLF